MTDIIDRAQDTADIMLEAQLRSVSKQKELVRRGTCYNCDDVVSPEQLFCDSDCGKDYEKRTRR